MSLLGMKGGTGIGTDPRFLGSIWTQIWTWLDSNPVIGSYGVEIFTKYAGILFTYYIIILGGGWGVKNWPNVDDVIYGRSLMSRSACVCVLSLQSLSKRTSLGIHASCTILHASCIMH